MSLRFDDLMGLSVARLLKSKTCIRGTLTRTKTTGPGKRVLEVPVFMHPEASFTGVPWISEGFAILGTADFAFSRDYFIPEPTTEYTSTRRHVLSYSQASGIYRLVLGSLKEVHRNGDGFWEEGLGVMLPE